jgi:hypothetical protein
MLMWSSSHAEKSSDNCEPIHWIDQQKRSGTRHHRSRFCELLENQPIDAGLRWPNSTDDTRCGLMLSHVNYLECKTCSVLCSGKDVILEWALNTKRSYDVMSLAC